MPLFEPVVVSFDDSTEVQASKATLLQDHSRIQTLSFSESDNFLNSMNLRRTFAEVVLIGHGTEEGILNSDGELVQWEKVIEWINEHPFTKVYFLACNSDGATELLGNKDSFGFNNQIDGITGAIIISSIMSIDRNDLVAIEGNLEELQVRRDEMIQNPDSIMFLAYLPGLGQLSEVEALVDVSLFVAMSVAVFFTALGAYLSVVSSTAYKTAIAQSFSYATRIQIFSAFFALFSAIVSANMDDIIGALFGVISELNDIVGIVINMFFGDIFTQILLIGLLAVDIAIWVSGVGSVVKATQVGLTLIGWVGTIILFNTDFHDCDEIPMRSVDCAPPPPPPPPPPPSPPPPTGGGCSVATPNALTGIDPITRSGDLILGEGMKSGPTAWMPC
jgi:hypothetical protein